LNKVFYSVAVSVHNVVGLISKYFASFALLYHFRHIEQNNDVILIPYGLLLFFSTIRALLQQDFRSNWLCSRNYP